MSITKNIYLLNCKWELPGTRQFIVGSLENQKFSNMHLINLSCPNYYLSGVCNALMDNATKNTDINNNEGITLFVYNPALSNRDADVIIISILSKMPYGVMLIFSESKVQGIINVINLSSKISKLELLNLIRMIRVIHLEQIQTYPWKQDLCCYGSKSELIINTFVGLLYKIICNHSICHLRIALQEKDTLIAYNVNYDTLKNTLRNKHEPIIAIYLSNCDIPSLLLYETLCTCIHDAAKICICNGYVQSESFIPKILSASLSIKEIFIHSLCYVNSYAIIPSDPQRCSIVLVTEKALVGHQPTTEQISLALQLEPSFSVLKLCNCQGNFDVFNQLVTMLATKSWTEVDFMNCTIGEIECEVLYEHLKMGKKHLSTVNTLKLSVEKLHTSLPKLVEIVLIWKVENLIFCGINHAFINCFFKKICTTNNREVFLSSVTYNNKKRLFCNLKSFLEPDHISQI